MGNSLCSRRGDWETYLSESQLDFFASLTRTVVANYQPVSSHSRLSVLAAGSDAHPTFPAATVDFTLSAFQSSCRSSNQQGVRPLIRIVQFIGSGSFGSVYLVQKHGSKQLFALKSMRKDRIVQLNQIEHVNQERDLLTRVDLAFIMKLYCTFHDPSHIHLLLEYNAGGDLFELLRAQKRFVENNARFYAAQVFMALEYLHSLNILYRDLKPENVMLNSKGYLKLGDFGFAKFVLRRTYTLCGTPDYIAPEMIMSRSYGPSVDWWAFGVFIYELLVGHSPFQSDNINVLYDKILKGFFCYPRQHSISAAARDLIEHLIVVDTTKRYGQLKDGPLDIREHLWFRSVNWDSLFHFRARPPHIVEKVVSQLESVPLPEINSHDDPYGIYFPFF